MNRIYRYIYVVTAKGSGHIIHTDSETVPVKDVMKLATKLNVSDAQVIALAKRYENVPTTGVRIKKDGRNMTFIDPRGFQVEALQKAVNELILTAILEDGEIKSGVVWHGGNQPLCIKSETYKSIQRAYNPPEMVPGKTYWWSGRIGNFYLGKHDGFHWFVTGNGAIIKKDKLPLRYLESLTPIKYIYVTDIVFRPSKVETKYIENAKGEIFKETYAWHCFESFSSVRCTSKPVGNYVQPFFDFNGTLIPCRGEMNWANGDDINPNDLLAADWKNGIAKFDKRGRL